MVEGCLGDLVTLLLEAGSDQEAAQARRAFAFCALVRSWGGRRALCTNPLLAHGDLSTWGKLELLPLSLLPFRAGVCALITAAVSCFAAAT